MFDVAFDYYSIIPHFCIVEVVTGLKCPFCDGVGAFQLLLSGHLVASLAENPLTVLFILLLFVRRATRVRWADRAFLAIAAAFFIFRNLAVVG